MSSEEISECLRGYSSKKYDREIINANPALKFDRIRLHLNLSRLELNILLAIYVRSGIQIRQLKDVISSLSYNRHVIPSLVSSGFIREVKRVGAGSWQSSRKFYLTGKGREIVKLYYQLMEG